MNSPRSVVKPCGGRFAVRNATCPAKSLFQRFVAVMVCVSVSKSQTMCGRAILGREPSSHSA